MNKIKYPVVIFLFVIMLTGCGDQKLICEKEENLSYVDFKTIMDYKFTDNKISFIKSTYISKLAGSEESDETNFNTYVELFAQASRLKYAELEGVKFVENKNSIEYIIEVSASGADVEKIVGIKNMTKGEVQEVSKAAGYNCK